MPPGLGNVPGLELAGEVEAIGPDVQRYKVGDRVFALVAEGAYAEYCLVDEGLALPIPPNWNFAKAAAVMEVACTTNETVFELGALEAEQTILVHAGASGVGTTAIQMAKSVGAKVLFTAGSQEKIDLSAASVETWVSTIMPKILLMQLRELSATEVLILFRTSLVVTT